MLETKQAYSEHKFKRLERDLLSIHKVMGRKSALNHINNLTKGLYDTKFVQEGEYWHGQPRFEYEKRKQQSLDRAGEQHQTEITAVLNEIK